MSQGRPEKSEDDDGVCAEVISPSAFDLPTDVPVTRYPGGPAIPGATAHLKLDVAGNVVAEVYVPESEAPVDRIDVALGEWSLD
jgi:hypothetical protein